MTRSEIRISVVPILHPNLEPNGTLRILAECKNMLEFLNRGPGLCALFVPKSEYENLSRALICGFALPPSREREWILDAGVMHLLIASGWHLFFLERALWFLPRILKNILLSIYAFLTGFHFPILRALFRRLSKPTLRARLGLTALQCEALAVMIFIICDPPCILSRSFAMCWMGGLAMALPLVWRARPNLDRALKAYLLLWPFCFASPITLFWNVALAPWVGAVIFPAVLLSLLLPSTVFLSDTCWRVFLYILRIGPSGAPLDISLKLFWLPALVHVALLRWEVKWRRARAFLLPHS